MNTYLEFQCALATWKKKLSGVPVRMGLSELAAFTFSLSDVLVSQDENRAVTKGYSIRCTKGCGACCRQVVPISSPEAFFLVDQVRQLDSSEIIFRFQESLKKLTSAGMMDLALMDQSPAYFSFGMSCPFLEKESCSIHPLRPIACREHLVFSRPESCATFPNSEIFTMPIFVSIREALGSTVSELTGTAPIMIPMVRMFEWVDSHEALHGQAWDAEYLLDLFVAKIGDHAR